MSALVVRLIRGLSILAWRRLQTGETNSHTAGWLWRMRWRQKPLVRMWAALWWSGMYAVATTLFVAYANASHFSGGNAKDCMVSRLKSWYMEGAWSSFEIPTTSVMVVAAFLMVWNLPSNHFSFNVHQLLSLIGRSIPLITFHDFHVRKLLMKSS